MRDNMLDVVVFAVIFKLFCVVWVNGFDLSTPWRFGEKLHGVAAIDFVSFLCWLRRSSGDRHVSTKNEHSFLLRDSGLQCNV